MPSMVPICIGLVVAAAAHKVTPPEVGRKLMLGMAELAAAVAETMRMTVVPITVGLEADPL